MKSMKNCSEHGIYPARFDSCPICNPDAKVKPHQPPTAAEMIAKMTDSQVKYIFQSFHWEQGKPATRQLCLDEYDKRFGLESWPSHISREI